MIDIDSYRFITNSTNYRLTLVHGNNAFIAQDFATMKSFKIWRGMFFSALLGDTVT